MKYVGYVRTGSHLQGVESQQELIREIASKNGFEIDIFFIDKGFSSKQFRPGFSDLQEMVKKEPTTVIITSVDRIHRESDKFLEFMSAVKKTGGKLLVKDKDFETNIITAELYENLRDINK